MEEDPPPPSPQSRSWSIYGRAEITQRYEVLERVGSGTYSDVYRGRRVSDGVVVALKEIHHRQSAFREIEALESLRHAPNVVDLLEYFWHDDEDDAVLVLEFLRSDLAAVIRDARRRRSGGGGGGSGGLTVGEAKRWMVQILRGVEACHRSCVVHRDLKPSNLLISADGVLKLADFGQSRILHEPRFVGGDDYSQAVVPEAGDSWQGGSENLAVSEPRAVYEEDYFQEVDGLKAKYPADELEKEMSIQDGDASCLATCSTSDVGDDIFRGSYSYEVDNEGGEEDRSGALTSCVGTRWYKAPELLYGSTDYGQEVDLWSLGCIFTELLTLEPIFPGSSDIDQLSRITSVLGNLTEEIFPGCSKLPDYSKISFSKVENPIGLQSHLSNQSSSEIALISRLVCYDPSSRATATEVLQDRYFSEEPRPVPLNELRVPSACSGQEESGGGNPGSDYDMEDFSGMDV